MTSFTPKIRVALLTGGISSEDYLSRRSCHSYYQALDPERYDFYLLDWQKNGRVIESHTNTPTVARIHPNLLSCFMHFRGDVVVNTLHGEKENSGQIQGLLELAKIPYTGNRLGPSALGMDKEKTKYFFHHLGINTPKSVRFELSVDSLSQLSKLIHQAGLHFPLIFKPIAGGSSDGIILIKETNYLATTYQYLLENAHHRAYFIEEFIQGKDLSFAIFNTGTADPIYTLPAAGIHYVGPFFDKQIKFEEQYQVQFPYGLSADITNKMQQAAIAIHQELGLTCFSRTDFILGDAGLFALEVNTHPGMSNSSILSHMLKEGGYTLSFFLDQMIAFSLNPQ